VKEQVKTRGDYPLPQSPLTFSGSFARAPLSECLEQASSPCPLLGGLDESLNSLKHYNKKSIEKIVFVGKRSAPYKSERFPLRLLQTFVGVLREKIRMRAILNENTAYYILLESLKNVGFFKKNKLPVSPIPQKKIEDNHENDQVSFN